MEKSKPFNSTYIWVCSKCTINWIMSSLWQYFRDSICSDTISKVASKFVRMVFHIFSNQILHKFTNLPCIPRFLEFAFFVDDLSTMPILPFLYLRLKKKELQEMIDGKNPTKTETTSLIGPYWRHIDSLWCDDFDIESKNTTKMETKSLIGRDWRHIERHRSQSRKICIANNYSS